MAEQVGSLSYMRDDYAAYQAKYRSSVKESDAAILDLVDELLARKPDGTIVDVGCHTGNLLFHLKQRQRRARLVGWDIFPAIVDRCRTDPALSGVEFDLMSVLDIKSSAVADILILSAVLGRFSDVDHDKAWKQIAKALRPGGHVVVFDWYHAYRQTVRIVDETDLHPEGLVLTMRSQIHLEEQLKGIGFRDVRFKPFAISVDLAKKDPADAVSTHTRVTTDGERLQFRGAIFQPWCHMTATKD